MHISLDILITGIILSSTEASTAAGVQTDAQSGFDFFLFPRSVKEILSFSISW